MLTYLFLVLPALFLVIMVWQVVDAYRFRLDWKASGRGSTPHSVRVVEPLHATLARLIDGAPSRWHEWITVPLDYADEGTVGTKVQLPAGLLVTPQLQAAITTAVAHKLGITDLDVSWQLAGNAPYVVFKPTPQAPRSVSYREVAGDIAAAKDTAPIVGITKFNRRVVLDLEDDSPHILISAGSGGGKSVLAKLLIAQFHARGARIVIFDRKRISHRWARNLPRVEYFRDTEEIHQQLIKYGGIGDVRNRQTDDEDRQFQRIVFVFEEMNATVGKLIAYWESIREKCDPKRSPAIEALGDLVNMGRQVSMHVIAIGQRIETRTVGGGDVRESFGIRCLTRYTVQTWKMLCADTPFRKRSAVRGRWQIVAGGEATETQVAFLTDQEAQSLALSQLPVPTALSPSSTSVGQPEWISLKDHFGAEYDRWRKRLQRASDGPEPRARVTHGADLYDRGELESWAATYATDEKVDA